MRIAFGMQEQLNAELSDAACVSIFQLQLHTLRTVRPQDERLQDHAPLQVRFAWHMLHRMQNPTALRAACIFQALLRAVMMIRHPCQLVSCVRDACTARRSSEFA